MQRLDIEILSLIHHKASRLDLPFSTKTAFKKKTKQPSGVDIYRCQMAELF